MFVKLVVSEIVGGVVASTMILTSLPSSWKTLSLMVVTLPGSTTSVSLVPLSEEDSNVCTDDRSISLSDDALWKAPDPNFITVGGRVILVTEEP